MRESEMQCTGQLHQPEMQGDDGEMNARVERAEPKISHYDATITIVTVCKETGKTTTSTLETMYHSGNEEPDKRTLNKKVLHKVIAEYKEVKKEQP